MTKLEMMELVDVLCEENGIEDAPAYDLIYSQCCEERTTEDATEMIKELLGL